MLEPPKKFVRIQFSSYTDEDIRNLSVLQVTNQLTFDQLGHPTVGGLYDRRLGPYDKSEICGTCSFNEYKCPGHIGHIELALPVYNPLWIRQLVLIVRGTCFNCKMLLDNTAMSEYMVCMVRLIDTDLWDKLEGLSLVYADIDSLASTKLIIKLREYTDQVIKDANIDEVELSSRKANRYVNQARQEIISQYMSAAFSCRKGHCPHCSIPIRKLRQEYNVRIFFDEGASRRGVEKAKRAFLSKKMQALKKLNKLNKAADGRGVREGDGDRVDDEGFDDGIEDDDDDIDAIEDLKKVVDINEAELEMKMRSMEARALLTPRVLRDHMRSVWDRNTNALKAICGMLNIPLQAEQSCKGDQRPTDIFFFSVIPVPPVRFRPVVRLRGRNFEHAVNAVYCGILETNDQIRIALQSLQAKGMGIDSMAEQSSTTDNIYESLHKHLIGLQTNVNNILDKDMCRLGKTAKPPGVRQVIEKKQGLFRKHMMGKRVDFAARSVISPDPFIAVDEVGLPEVFATKLTFPEPVNLHNVERLRKAVLNGPNVHPGATHVMSESGVMMKLSETMREQREAASKTLMITKDAASLDGKTKIVYRHIHNGDMLLMNRQPTLHRPSIQAHRAHVLPKEKTIRLHYANCNAYNADFDGDEMNAHFPQSFLGQSEARQIVATHNQYLVPKNGAPLAGLIQDHVIGGVALSMRGRFFTKQEYQQLVFSGLVDAQCRVQFMLPAVIKPRPLWTGKQVVSTVLRTILPGTDESTYISLQGTSKVSAKSWLNRQPLISSVDKMGEETVVFRHGHLLQGVIDKNHFGATKNGLVHYCYELYGGAVCNRLLTSLARLFTTFLKFRGFSLGVEDILCLPQADEQRLRIMREGSVQGASEIAKALGIADKADDVQAVDQAYAIAQFDEDNTRMKEVDLSMKSISDQIQNDITKVIMPLGLLKKFPANNLQLMTVAGAKGSSVNCMQISCLLGQIELEGRRPPLMPSGRSLPSFRAYDTTPRAGGFVDGRFLSGIRPQEYFFHCMAGREGLVDTAVKTSRSGYLQRCLIKHLEGILVSYDSTARDSDGSVIQFNYGDDGMCVLKTNLLTTKQVPFLVNNKNAVRQLLQSSILKQFMDKKKAKKWHKKISEYKDTWRQFTRKDRRGVFLKYSEGTEESELSATKPLLEKQSRLPEVTELIDRFRALSDEEREAYVMYADRCPDPTITVYPPNTYLHSIPEKLREEIDSYVQANPDQLIISKSNQANSESDADGRVRGELKITADDLDELMACYSCRCRAEPGDAVGVVAAQSIGEPSTQMTLNTFHFAGRGEMNVTLGIPRLREILMVASKQQKTPFMDIPFKQTKHAKKRAKNLQLKLNLIRLSEVLENIDVRTVYVTTGLPSDWGKVSYVRLNFLPPSQYVNNCLLTPQFILKYVESTFVKDLCAAYQRALKRAANSKLITAMAAEASDLGQAPRQSRNNNDEGEGDGNFDEPQDGRDVGQQEQPESDDENLEDEAGVDHDAVADREIRRHAEEHEYEDEEEDDIDELLGNNEAGADDDNDDDGDPVTSEDEATTSMFDRVSSLSTRKRLSKSRGGKEMSDIRVQNVIRHPGVVGYEYDAEDESWCQITFKYPLTNSDLDIAAILQSIAHGSLVCDPSKVVKGVSKAILSQPKSDKDPVRLKTDGVNITKMFMYSDILDLENLYSNDIHAMSDTYGIEAARTVLIKEVRDVFAAYGIGVDYRHLSLIADYMTFEGSYKAFNRNGLMSSASVLQKMTFEASTMFLKTAMLSGAYDDIESPSARLVVGRPVKCGTGIFDCLMKLHEE